MKKSLRSYFLPYIILFLFCIPVIIPYFHKGHFITQDGEWAIVRSAEMYREIKDFQFPPRYSGYLNAQYGYPLFNFAYPLPYYLSTILHFFRLGFISSMKLLFILSVILSAFFTFLASKTLWKSSISGFISALLFTFLPYRIVDLYVRGSIGESISFVLFPLITYYVINVYRKPFSKINIFFASLAYASLIIAHNIMVLYFSMFLAFIILICIFLKKYQTVFSYLLFITWGCLLSSYFVFPAILEKNLVLFSKIPIAIRDNFFVTFNQFVIPPWLHSNLAENAGFSYQIGIVHLILFSLLIITIFCVFRKKQKCMEFYYCAVFLSACALIFTFFLFPVSGFLWKIIPILKDVNFPWTMLGIIGFIISLTSGFLGTFNNLKYAALVAAISSVFLILPYAKPQAYTTRDDNFYLSNDATTTASYEFMPLWVKKNPTNKPTDKIEMVKGNGRIGFLSYNSKKLTAEIFAQKPLLVRINIMYYPGWTVYINDKRTSVNYDNEHGVMDVQLFPGKNTVRAQFFETPFRFIFDLVSLASFFALLALVCMPIPFIRKK